MKKYKLIFGTAVLGIVLSISGCKKSFLDINDNPNLATDNNITPDLIFPAGAVGVGARATSGNFTFLNNWMGYLSSSGTFAIQQDETSYNFDRSGYEPIWQNHYNVLFDLYQTKTKALANKDSVLAGASMILSAKLWQELVDLYGNIPYSDAFNAQNTVTPKYDKDYDVYRQLHQSLDKAISYMHGTASLKFPTTVASVKFGTLAGTNQAAWIRYANTLKLRLLIHAADAPTVVPGIDRPTEIAKILAEGGILGSGETVYINPGYVNETSKQNPFWATYGFTITGADANTSSRANIYQTNVILSGDPRLARIYAVPSAGGAITGTKYGQAVPANPDDKHSSKHGPGLLVSAAQNQPVLTSVEALFLRAEAINRGWIAGTPDVTTAYNNAVQESFTYLGAGSATTYLASHAYSGLATAASTGSIIFQKYVALNSIDVIESYVDYRRFNASFMPTGYISVNPSRINTTTNKLPNRFLYPQEEYTLNSANVLAQGNIDNNTIFTGSKIFWQP